MSYAAGGAATFPPYPPTGVADTTGKLSPNKGFFSVDIVEQKQNECNTQVFDISPAINANPLQRFVSKESLGED
jgi:hypothetical protein